LSDSLIPAISKNLKNNNSLLETIFYLLFNRGSLLVLYKWLIIKKEIEEGRITVQVKAFSREAK